MSKDEIIKALKKKNIPGVEIMPSKGSVASVNVKFKDHIYNVYFDNIFDIYAVRGAGEWGKYEPYTLLKLLNTVSRDEGKEISAKLKEKSTKLPSKKLKLKEWIKQNG